MTFWNSLRTSFVSALHHPALWLVQFFGNVAIFLLFARWLTLGEEALSLVFTVVLTLLMIAAAIVLQGGTLNYYADLAGGKAALFPAFKRALKHALAFALLGIIVYLLLSLVARLDNYQYQVPGYLRSECPAWLRRLISEQAMDNLYVAFVAFLRWILVPGLFLPLALSCSSLGFRGFLQLKMWWRSVRRLSYWIVLILAGLIGIYCTGKLMDWRLHPQSAAVTKEGIWFGFRLLVAYLMVLFSWFWICAVLAGAGRSPDPPAASQRAAA